jgi:hypothetical protein
MSVISKHSKLHRLVVGGLVAVAAAAPLALAAAPAQAATSSGCTVTPLKPVFAGFNSSGVKVVRYKVSISCSGDRSVTVQQLRYEDDKSPDADDNLGSSTFTRSFDGAGSITVNIQRALPNTEGGNEEIYQRVRFRVSSNGVTSPFTSWQNSPVLSIPN